MFNEGPIPEDMMPSIRNLIANLEGYRNDTDKGEPVRDYKEESLNHLAMLMMIGDQDEKITNLETKLSNTSASTGFLVLMMLLQWAVIIYLFASR